MFFIDTDDKIKERIDTLQDSIVDASTSDNDNIITVTTYTKFLKANDGSDIIFKMITDYKLNYKNYAYTVLKRNMEYVIIRNTMRQIYQEFKDIKTYTERINANDVLTLIYKSDEAAKSHINVALHNEGICRQFNIS